MKAAWKPNGSQRLQASVASAEIDMEELKNVFFKTFLSCPIFFLSFAHARTKNAAKPL
jgi:hypothetical protein